MIMAVVLPPAVGQSMFFPNESDFGVHADVADILAEIEDRRTSVQIVQETEGVLAQVYETEYDRRYLVNSTEGSGDITETEFIQPPSDNMVDTVLTQPLAGYSSIWDFLLENPLEYYIYYKYDDDPHEWVEGSAINANIFEPTELDWTELDVDNDPATGEGGNDIQVRFKFEARQVNIELLPGQITIPPNLDALVNLSMYGGLGLQVENLNPTPGVNDAVPLDIGVAKSVSFDGKNYLVLLQYRFEEKIPEHYSLSLLMNFFISGATLEVIGNFLNGDITDLDDTLLEAVDGPYVIEWGPSTVYASFLYDNALEPFMTLILGALGIPTPEGGRYPVEDLPNLNMMAGIGNVTENEVGDPVWREISWIKADCDPVDVNGNGPDDDLLPGLGNLTLDTRSENAAFDEIRWYYPDNDETDVGRPSNVTVIYRDARYNESLWVNLDIEEMPFRISLHLRNTTQNDSEVLTSRLSLDGSSVVKRFNYTEHLYHTDPWDYPRDPRPGNEYRIMHIDMWDIPRRLVLKGTFDSGSGPDPVIGGGNLLTYLFNAVISYFYKGFWGVGETLRSMSDRMFNMPADSGWFELNMMGSYLGGVEFWYTSDSYVYLSPEKDGEKRNFVAFYRAEGELIETPISGRVEGIGDMNIYFSDFTSIDLHFDPQLEKTRAFYFIYVDQEAVWEGVPGFHSEDATLKIDSLPSNLFINVTDRTLLIDCFDSTLGDIAFSGTINGTYMLLEMDDFPNRLELYNHEGLMDLNFTGTLGALELVISDNGLFRLPGSYILMKRNDTTTMISARIESVERFTYNTRNGTRFAYELSNSYPLYVGVNDTIRETYIKAAVNPIPQSIDLKLNVELSGESISVPSVGNISSVFDLSNVLVGVAEMGDSVTNMLSNVTQGGLDILKDLGSNDKFDYASTYNLNIVAEIQVGDISQLGPVEWTHGVSARQAEIDGDTVMHALIYINGMPQTLDLLTYTEGRTMDFEFHVQDFSSKYNWILLDVEGLKGRDLFVYMKGLQEDTDVDLDMNITVDETPNGIPMLNGYVDFTTNKDIDAIYLTTTDSKSPQTSFTLYADSPPRTGNITFDVDHETHLEFNGAGGVEKLMLDVGKYLDDRWWHTHVVATDVPSVLSIDTWANPEYDMDDPNPLQGLPTVEITASSGGTSALISFDGRGLGQAGDLEIYARNIGRRTKLWMSGDTLHASGDIEYLMMRYSNMPLMEQYELRSLEVRAKDIEKLEVSIRMTFGTLPIVSVDATDCGDIRITLDHEIDILGKRKGNVVLVDFSTNGFLPAGAPTAGVNEIELEGGREHTVMPDPVSTLLLTLLGG